MFTPVKGLSINFWHLCSVVLVGTLQSLLASLSYFVTEWVLSTNHRSIAVLYFFFVLLSGFTGLILATIISLELAYPGQFFLTNNAESYLTTISLHGVVMVFFMIIPVIFGAFGNFLLPTQLGIRDVAFPSLNSFMFWVTPSGFVLLLHIILFDRSYNLTYWLNYGEVKAALSSSYSNPVCSEGDLFPLVSSDLDWSLNFSPTSLNSTYEASKSINPSSSPLFSSPFSEASFASGAGSQANPGSWGPLYFNPTFSDQGPNGLILSPFSSENGGVVLSSLSGQFGTPSDVLTNEVMRGYVWGGDSHNPEPLKLASAYSFGSSLSQSSFEAPQSVSSPLVDGNDIAMDWSMLNLERELWRSADFLGQGLQTFWYSRSYYTNLFSPSAIVNKVSIWLPNNLIPGWAFVTPYSSRLSYTALGKVDIALIVVFLASLGSVFSAVNYVITYSYIGAPIFKGRSELSPFFIDGLLVGSSMMILANPALLIGIILLLSDSHFGTSVFDFSGGGDTILFQHLFWFFGHPEVYIIIIPCFGFMNSLLPYYLSNSLSGSLSLQFSMYTIAFMGFAVWGHHMYMVGLANSVRTLYSTMTVMISVPASTKVLHWCVTIIQSSPTLDVGFCFLLSFMYFFVLGGLSGMFNAHIGFDTLLHDTFYVIGHFHVMLAGAAMSCVFAAFYFYFAAIFGISYSSFFAYLHFVFYLSGQLITLIPMFWLGYAGMPRSVMDYPSAFGGWHSLASSGHLLTVFSFVFFLLMLADSFYENSAPVSNTSGVSSLNTRLAFYTYEVSKLAHWSQRSLVLLRPQIVPSVASTLFTLETSSAEYVFTFNK